MIPCCCFSWQHEVAVQINHQHPCPFEMLTVSCLHSLNYCTHKFLTSPNFPLAHSYREHCLSARGDVQRIKGYGWFVKSISHMAKYWVSLEWLTFKVRMHSNLRRRAKCYLSSVMLHLLSSWVKLLFVEERISLYDSHILPSLFLITVSNSIWGQSRSMNCRALTAQRLASSVAIFIGRGIDLRDFSCI